MVALEAATGLPALRLTMVRPYRIDLGFDLRRRTAGAPVNPRRRAAVPSRSPPPTCRWPRWSSRACRWSSAPYADWAAGLGCAEADVHRLPAALARRRHHQPLRRRRAPSRVRLRRQRDDGVRRRPDEQVDACGAALASRRRRHAGLSPRARAGWRYNLYCMVRRDRDAVLAVIDSLVESCGLAGYPRRVLFSPGASSRPDRAASARCPRRQRPGATENRARPHAHA